MLQDVVDGLCTERLWNASAGSRFDLHYIKGSSRTWFHHRNHEIEAPKVDTFPQRAAGAFCHVRTRNSGAPFPE